MATVQGASAYFEIYDGAAYDKLCSVDDTFSMDLEIDDITDKCSSQWKTSSGQIRTLSGSSNFVYKTTTEAYASLKAAYMTGSPVGQVLAHYVAADATTYAGTMQITNLTESSAHNQEVRGSLAFEFTGTVSNS
jgi:predicted secreted protein